MAQETVIYMMKIRKEEFLKHKDKKR